MISSRIVIELKSNDKYDNHLDATYPSVVWIWFYIPNNSITMNRQQMFLKIHISIEMTKKLEFHFGYFMYIFLRVRTYIMYAAKFFHKM